MKLKLIVALGILAIILVSYGVAHTLVTYISGGGFAEDIGNFVKDVREASK